MSELPSRKSHATAWTLTVILAVPLLYLRSAAPLTCLTVRTLGISSILDKTPYSTGYWFDAYFVPYLWLYGHSPTTVQQQLDAYAQWWLEVTHSQALFTPPP